MLLRLLSLRVPDRHHVVAGAEPGVRREPEGLARRGSLPNPLEERACRDNCDDRGCGTRLQCSNPDATRPRQDDCMRGLFKGGRAKLAADGSCVCLEGATIGAQLGVSRKPYAIDLDELVVEGQGDRFPGSVAGCGRCTHQPHASFDGLLPLKLAHPGGLFRPQNRLLEPADRLGPRDRGRSVGLLDAG